MKKIFIPALCILVLTLAFINQKHITNYIMNLIIGGNKLIIKPTNEYQKNYDYDYIQKTTNYIPYSYQDLLNIVYSAINAGWDDFTFYCPSEYKDCVKDITSLSDNENALTHLNNFVHPFNSFTNLKTTISDLGEVTLNIYYLYSKEQISKINQEVDNIIKKIITNDLTDYDKIKTIHDYIINNTKYDVTRNEKKDSIYKSYIAYGPLFEGYATCNGYTDLMAIFLTKLGFNNFKIATTPEEISIENSTGHVWNAVYVNNKWLHLDLTWDDPVSNTGKDYLYHTYFLITTEEMEEADSGEVVMEEHKFNKSIYIEMKNRKSNY